ncbi:2-amino-4-hydroxy-6-hydroxymethyldihydropteridine diphosphokinase [Nitratireductor luteus]|uniref:2-amino-4-hydroxy-6- hydroxymethyldihydropteridine diphosphokinase n=1 Tax=Nitratireductor luteus TaxID=2976980 RepID=UPI002240D13F|nr:2-amino-4-hydroxy-6-hydroxymethyldihydropteridine diphosphokinase [Nitratireductor luteus]
MSGRNSAVTPARAFLGFGGNIGKPAHAMSEALRRIDAAPENEILAVSRLYRTPPWGKLDQPDFLNAACLLSTRLGPAELLEFCLRVERSLKRVRNERWGPRVIDIDLLLYGDEHVAREGLEVPHPRMLERAFVLRPLAEIAPGLHIAGAPVEKHLAALDQAGIEPASSDGGWWRSALKATAH